MLLLSNQTNHPNWLYPPTTYNQQTKLSQADPLKGSRLISYLFKIENESQSAGLALKRAKEEDNQVSGAQESEIEEILIVIGLMDFQEDRISCNINNQMEKCQPFKTPIPSYFSLSRLKPHCHYPPVTVDFSDPIPRHTHSSVFPIYNHDLRHFTPAFLLSSEKPCSTTYLTSEEEKFQGKMRIECEQLECHPLQVSSLRLQASESKYCQVCKERFQDYWDHMATKGHQRRVIKNQFNQDIALLCQKIKPKQGPEVTQECSSPGQKKGRDKNRSNDGSEGLARCRSEILTLGMVTNLTQTG